jgi:hypothetical protein
VVRNFQETDMRFNLLSSLRRQGVRAGMIAAVGVAAWAAAGAAHAGSNVYWSVGVAAPGVQVGVANAPAVYGGSVYGAPVYGAPAYVQAAPVYVQPAPVYAAPAPVYYRPRVVAPVVYRPVVRPYGYGYRHHRHGPRPVPYYAPGAYGVGPAATVGYGP